MRSTEQANGTAMEGDVVPNLLATTGATYSCSITEFRRREKDSVGGENEKDLPILSLDDADSEDTNYFKSIQW